MLKNNSDLLLSYLAFFIYYDGVTEVLSKGVSEESLIYFCAAFILVTFIGMFIDEV